MSIPVFERLERLAAALAGPLAAAAVLGMVAMVTFEVTARSLFNAPTSWVTEFSAYLLVATVFIGAAAAHRAGYHIRVEVLLNRTSGPCRSRLEAVAAWLGTAFLCLLAWKLVAFVRSEYSSGARDWGLLSTPLWIPESPMILGAALFALALLGEARSHSSKVNDLRDLAVACVLSAGVLALWAVEVQGLGRATENLAGVAVIALSVVVSAAIWSGAAVALSTLAVLAATAGLLHAVAGGPPAVVAIALVVALALLLAVGMRIGLALGLLAALSITALLPVPLLQALPERAWASVNSSTLTAVPMFVFMGRLLLRSGVSSNLFEAMRRLFGRVPGSFAYASIGACGVFAAASGSSLATAATMGAVSVPEMLRHGYSRRLTYGVIAAGGTLGILIPPSIAMILYGSTVGVPISDLFIAGILPGLLLMAMFAATVLAWVVLRRNAAPAGQAWSWMDKARATKGVVPFLLLILGVIGSLYLGIATPTEAGAIGSVAAALLCAARRSMTPQVLFEAVVEAASVTTFLLIIVIGAAQFSYVLDYLRLPVALVEWVQLAEVSAVGIVISVVFAYVLLGMFIDPISMMLMTLPVVMPLVQSTDLDPLWFGVVLVIVIEIGLITPPVGMILFTLKGIERGRARLDEVAYGALPFVFTILLAICLITLFPEVVMWLPAQLR